MGACEELQDRLVSHETHDVVYVAFPFGANRNSYIQADLYSDGQVVSRKRSLFRFKLPETLAYIKDFFYALLYTLKYAYKADVLV